MAAVHTGNNWRHNEMIARVALAPVLQIHGRKWEATAYLRSPQTAHIEGLCSS